MHEQIESLAGAIALGEATDGDRRFYREHIAGCSDCLRELGGEHEILRTAGLVHAARDEEIWEPDIRQAFHRGLRASPQMARFATAFVVTAIVAAVAIHSYTPPKAPAMEPPVAAMDSRPAPVAEAAQIGRKLVVYHNVVQLARAPLVVRVPSHADSAPKAMNKPSQIAALTIYPQSSPAPQPRSKVPVWRREPSWQTVARITTTSLTETAPQRVSSAESLMLGSALRSRTVEAAPVGGETAISPRPPMIAYAEQVEGTTAFEVMIDERGAPTKCVITKPAGYRFLDDAVCRAAMNARYTPKSVAGKPVPGIYRDAFTFRTTPDSNEGVPNLIPHI